MPPSAPRSILVIQLRQLGDVVLTVPALEALKKRYPTAKLDFLVEAPGAEALAGHPAVDEILRYDAKGPLEALRWALRLRARRYDWVIDFLATPRSALLTLLSGAALKAGPGHVSRRWVYHHRMVQSPQACYAALEKVRWLSGLGVTPADAPELPHLFLAQRPSSTENVVGLAPASRRPTRRWPAKSFARLGRLLRDKHGCRLKIFWGPGEKALAEEVSAGIGIGAEICPPTRTIADLARELVSCRLLVSNCSGTKHVALAHGVPTVTVHGSSDPASWTPRHPKHLFVRQEPIAALSAERVLPLVEALL